MRPFNEKRPSNIECDNIWELYKIFVTLDDPYIKTRLKGDDKEYLYLITNVCLESGDTEYSFDDRCNMNLPCCRKETIRLDLVRMLCNEEISKELDISINSIFECYRKLSVEEILDWHDISFPDKAELQEMPFVQNIPVTDTGEMPEHKTGRPHKGRGLTNQERATCFRSYLDNKNICYEYDTDFDVPRITMFFKMPDCAVGHIESSICFFEHQAEVRTYYPEPVSEMFGGDSHLEELLILLTFLNALVFPCQTKDEVYLVPRFCTTISDFKFTALTVINYKIWNAVPDTETYITDCLPEVLNAMAPFIVSVLDGKLTSDEAMKQIDINEKKRDE